MKRLLTTCLGIIALLSNAHAVNADELLITLDLRNTYRNDALGGGTWQLFVRKVETGTEPQGDFGVSGIRALIDNISLEGIAFAPGIGQAYFGAPFTQVLSNGTVEIIYQQDLNGTVIEGVGVPVLPQSPFRDRLIASGTWPGGPRPVFGMDLEGLFSSGQFLGGDSALILLRYPPQACQLQLSRWATSTTVGPLVTLILLYSSRNCQ